LASGTQKRWGAGAVANRAALDGLLGLLPELANCQVSEFLAASDDLPPMGCIALEGGEFSAVVYDIARGDDMKVDYGFRS
jgi:hypothetical protein